MTANATSTQRRARSAKSLRGDYRLVYGVALLTALLALAGWIWAVVIAFGSVSTPGLGYGMDSACGSPVFFDRAAFAQQHGDDWTTGCADTVDKHIREALGFGLVATPIGALWLFSASQLPRLRAVADLAAENEKAEPEGEPSS
jgi:hypothetical protein